MAVAGGIHTIPITSLPVARSPIAIDGSLADWPDTHAASFDPLDAGLTKSDAASIKTVRTLKIKPSVQACYDSKALYVGVTWNGVGADAVGDVTVTLAADRTAQVRVARSATGVLSVQQRAGDGAAWEASAAAGAISTGSGAKVEEIRIPWSLVTPGPAPKGKVNLAFDFSWPVFSTAFLKQLPAEVRHDNTHQTFCFLTSPAKLFTQDAYLPGAGDWGTLTFADGERANTTQSSATATGATETNVSRVATPVVVDGSLQDWPTARFHTATLMPGVTGKRYSAAIATAYDNNNLYVAVRFNAINGPLNVKPQSSQAGYAGGDDLQIRLNDGKRSVNLCAWYDSINKKPALTADGNDLKNPYLLEQGATEAFVASPDGASYTQEIAVPWNLIREGAAPAPGDKWRGTFQFWWAGLDPSFTVTATPTLEKPGGIPCTYTLAAESNVTIAVYDKQGHLLRHLAKDAHRRTGKNVEYWDGRDQFGMPVAAGDYIIKGLSHPPIDTEYVMSAVNPGTPAWPTPDGKGDWISDEASTQGTVTDGRNVYLAAPGSEKGYAIIAVGPNGQRTWGYREESYPRCVSLALSGKYLYALFSGPELTESAGRYNGKNAISRAYIICLDKETGVPAAFSAAHPRLRVATWPYVDKTTGLWDMRNARSFSPATYGGQPRYFANDLGETTEAQGIAAVDGKLYVSMFEAGHLLVLDAATGKQLDTIDVSHPVGLHATSTGKLLAISDGKVVAIDRVSKAVTSVIAHDLLAPHDVTTDAKGNVYVSDWGASFQVKVFAPSGKLLRAIGKAGGRPWVGAWEQGGMLLPRGIAVTDSGQLWVAEDDAAPTRVSVWNSETGAFVRDYLGPAPYGGAGFAWGDPKDSTLLFGEGVFWRIDPAKKTWTPLATAFRRMGLDEAFTPNAQFGPAGSRSIEHAGKQYLFLSNGYNMTVLRRDGLRLVPVAAVGSRGRYITDQGASQEIWDSDIARHFVAGYYPPFFDGHKGDNYVWVDLNDDGKVQPDEMQWAKTLTRGDKYVAGKLPEFLANWGCGISKQGSVFIAGFCGDNNAVVRLDVTRWTSSGVPVYSLAAANVIHQDGISAMPQGLYASDTDKLFISRSYEWGRAKTAIDCYTLDGAPLWSMAMPTAQRADDIQSDQITGEIRTKNAGTILATWLWHGNYRSYLMTEDGMYVSTLLDDTLLGPKANWGESFRTVFQSANGDAFLINGANDSYHILKITGLDQIQRFSSPLTVTAADVQAVAEAAEETAAAPSYPKPIIHVAWRNGGSVPADTAPNAVTLQGAGKRSALVAVSRDAASLNLSYQVKGAQLVNKGTNWQNLFITGDCADVMLSATPGKTHYKPEAGDIRVLFSVFQGKPIAVLYRPVVPGATSPVKFMAATIDQVTRLESATVAVDRSSDGYTLTASVPLKDIGIDTNSIQTLKGDVGVIFADSTGTNRAERVYYFNKHTEMVNDLTTEATLQPGEWGDVEMPLGENLLKNGDFSESLASAATDGWLARDLSNGGEVKLDDTVAYSGKRSLLAQMTQPVVYDEKAYLMPSYDEYLKSANGGKGGGSAAIAQNIPVTAGKAYHLRLHYISKGLQFEEKALKPGRGYCGMMVWIYWLGAKKDGATWVANEQVDPADGWKTIFDASRSGGNVNAPYIVPEGATAAQVAIFVVSHAAGKQPVVHIDDVEFAEAK
jgi:hypothetical protein